MDSSSYKSVVTKAYNSIVQSLAKCHINEPIFLHSTDTRQLTAAFDIITTNRTSIRNKALTVRTKLREWQAAIDSLDEVQNAAASQDRNSYMLDKLVRDASDVIIPKGATALDAYLVDFFKEFDKYDDDAFNARMEELNALTHDDATVPSSLNTHDPNTAARTSHTLHHLTHAEASQAQAGQGYTGQGPSHPPYNGMNTHPSYNGMNICDASQLQAPTIPPSRNGYYQQFQEHPLLPNLPPVTLSKFSGVTWQFPAYWERFDELIHSRPMADICKFSYLISSLEGEALALISTLPQTSANYDIAIQLLRTTYHNPLSTKLNLLKMISRISSPSTSTAHLLTMLMQIRSYTAQLSQIEHVEDNTMLISQILEKFPRFIKLHVVETLGDDGLQLSTMMKTIERKLRQHMMVSELEHDGTNKGNRDRNASYSTRFTPRPSSNHDNRSSYRESSKPTPAPSVPSCVYCGKHRGSNNCREVKAIDERRKIVHDKKLCVCCLLPGHAAATCKMVCRACNNKHHFSLCQSARNSIESTNVNVANAEAPRARLLTTRITLMNPDTLIPTSCDAILDPGSTVTLISKKICDELMLHTTTTYNTQISGSTGLSERRDYPVVKALLAHREGSLPFAALCKEEPLIHSHLQYDELSEADNKALNVKYNACRIPCGRIFPQVLLGIQECNLLLAQASSETLPSGYTLHHTVIGPIVSGGTNIQRQLKNFDYSNVITEQAEELQFDSLPSSTQRQLEEFLALDSVSSEKAMTEKETRSIEDKNVEDHFQSTVRYENNEYIVQYCTKENISQLPDNFEMSLSRLRSLYKNLVKDKDMLIYYNKLLQEQLRLGQIEIVDNLASPYPVHYIAHQSVERKDKPSTPLRIVFDGSAKKKGALALNDVICTGPNLLDEISAIMIRSRMKKTMMIADVERAFLQIRLDPSQRDMLRFIWIKDIDKPPSKDNLQIYRFSVTPFGVNQSPYLLNRVIRHHLESSTTTETAREIAANIYVDNVIFATNEPSVTLYQESKQLFSSMHMNLRGYASNDDYLNSCISEEDRGDLKQQKFFGIVWDLSEDTFTVKVPKFSDNKCTKRTVLSCMASIYDPIGLLAPLVFPLKRFMQHLWDVNYKWDDPLPMEDATQWMSLKASIEDTSYRVPRYIGDEDKKIDLFLFSDASAKGEAACVYIRSSHDTNLIMSRSRITPRNNTCTIPKLELEAATMAMHLVQHTVTALSKSHDPSTIIIHPYTDSTTVIYWVEQEKEYKYGPYVGNRVNRIHSIKKELESRGVTVLSFNYVPTESNPADHATRGLTKEELLNHEHQWWKGPSWLRLPENQWPSKIIPMEHITLTGCSTNDDKIDLIDFNRFSSLKKVVKVIGYVQRFARNIRAKMKRTPTTSSRTLTPMEQKEAYTTFIRITQRNNVDNVDELLDKNVIKIDAQGIMRSKTRMNQSSLPSTAIEPIYLTQNDKHAINLIIFDIHHSSHHSGVEQTLNTFKMCYSLKRARAAVKSSLKNCYVCRRLNNRPYYYRNLHELPETRITPSLPFTHTGIDFLGPIQSSDGMKLYILLFTCMATRLVHCECVTTMDTVTVIEAVKRMAARRGTPKTIRSDSAPSFKQSSKIIIGFDTTDEEFINTFYSETAIEWHHTTPHAPWRGAVYERLVGIFKRALYKSIGKKKLTLQQFTTITCEIEATMNCRPLTYVPEERMAIRPIDFILPGAFLGVSTTAHADPTDPDFSLQVSDLQYSDVMKRLAVTNKIRDKYWDLWSESYLLELRDRPSNSPIYNDHHHSAVAPNVGDVVILVDDSENTPRHTWPLAKIISLDGQNATLRSSSGRIVQRPINLLIPMEISSQSPEPLSDTHTHSNTHHMNTRSKASH